MKLHRTLTASLIAFCFLGSAALAAPVAEVSTDAAGVYFLTDGGDYQLTVTGPEGYYHRSTSSAPAFSVADSEGLDGTYTYELVAIPAKAEGEDRNQVIETRSQSGAFTIAGGSVVDPNLAEQGFDKAQVFTTDLITQGSACIGFDCTSSESFSFDTLRLKENNLRVHFNDTSSSASFPGNDWRIVANDSTNGGGNYFAIEDSTAGRQVFRVEAGAIANALYVSAAGDVGVGTSTPVVEVHGVDGNTPTFRLEQNGSSGFTPQTWDIAGNETNFFIRDVTNGSKLPFRIEPGTGDNALYLDSTGNVGMGTNAPAFDLHVRHTGGVIAQLESTDGGAVQMRLKSDSSDNRRVLAENGSGTAQSQIILGDNGSFTFAGASTPANDVMSISSAGVVSTQSACIELGSFACTASAAGMSCVSGSCP